MYSFPVLAGATYFDRYIFIGSKPRDQNVGSTELANAMPGGVFSWMAPIDTSHFVVSVNGRTVSVTDVDMNIDSMLTLAQPIRPGSRVLS